MGGCAVVGDVELLEDVARVRSRCFKVDARVGKDGTQGENVFQGVF